MSDLELESDSDEEKNTRDIQKLKAAAVQDDDPCASTSGSAYTNTNSSFEEYSKLQTLLSINRMYDSKMLQLEKTLLSRLLECRQRLNEINKNKSNNEKKEKARRFNYLIYGKPYFRDKRNLPAPDNEDTVIIRKYHMYDYTRVPTVVAWRENDKTMFLKVLLKMSQAKRKLEIKSKIGELRRQSKGQLSTNKKEISELKRKIRMVNKMPLEDVALPLDEEYDWECVADRLNYRHKAVEYRALWKLVLHPTINKTPWSESEHTSLLKIASDENQQNWNKIASLLGTGRTGYLCFVYFRANMINITIKGKKWTKEEEEYLSRLIKFYKEDNYIPWAKVASAMENRTKLQIYTKYLRLTELRKGRFLKEEDAVILTCADKFGANFRKIAKFLPGRSPTQCRVRFQILKKKVSTVWTVEEDQKLVELLNCEDVSVNFSNIAKHFPDKDRKQIRTRHLILTRWMKQYPNVDIAKAPRRTSRKLAHGHPSHELSSAVTKLRIKLESEANNKKLKKNHMNFPESVIDREIEAILEKENRELEEASSWDASRSHPCAKTDEMHDPPQCNIQNLRKILYLLRVKLEKNIYLESPLSKKYNGLIEPDKDISSVIKVKSYSRQKVETHLKVDSAPDIWGTKCLPPPTYVVPPNFSTITGCQKLLSFTSTNTTTTTTQEININRMINRNTLIKNETNLLMERFKTLFLWPMMLANQPPKESEPHQFDKGDWNGVAIPKHKAEDEVNSVIDLDKSASSSDADE